jgi:hypothetical protein
MNKLRMIQCLGIVILLCILALMMLDAGVNGPLQTYQ